MPASPLTYMLMEVHKKIPHQILEAAFLKEDQPKTSVDERITKEVFKKQILLDTNLVATRQCRIPLSNAWVEYTEASPYGGPSTYLYDCTYVRIPPEAREFRNIASVVKVIGYMAQPGVSSIGAISGWSPGGNTVSSMGAAMVGSYTLQGASWYPIPVLQNDNLVRLTGIYPNTVLDCFLLECTLENDEEYTNVGQDVIFYLKKLAVEGVKLYIYTNLKIPMGETYVVAGMDIGVFKEIVDSYQNAGEEYDRLLDLVRGAQIFDPNTFAQYAYLAV